MTILKELCVAQRKYTAQSGEEKTVWLKIGEIHANSQGKEYGVIYPHINLAALPRKEGEDRVFFNLFDPRPKEGQAPKQASRQAAPPTGGLGDFEDDIPFNRIGDKLAMVI